MWIMPCITLSSLAVIILSSSSSRLSQYKAQYIVSASIASVLVGTTTRGAGSFSVMMSNLQLNSTARLYSSPPIEHLFNDISTMLVISSNKCKFSCTKDTLNASSSICIFSIVEGCRNLCTDFITMMLDG